MLYNVKFPDGTVKPYSANIIAQNMYSQVDEDGYSKSGFHSIVDYKKDKDAVPMNQKYIVTKSGQKRCRQSTAGWKLLVKFEDASTQWIPLKILKETNPVEVAELAISNKINEQPAFHWWVPYTLKQHDRIISAVTSQVR